jgi:TonB-dependent starch-binding outer membrane protein SusC
MEEWMGNATHCTPTPQRSIHAAFGRWCVHFACAIFAAGLLAVPAFAQNKVYVIKGQVTENGSGNKPVRGVLVRLVPQGTGANAAANAAAKSFGAYADGNGSYTLTANTPAGNYLLTGRYLGYKEAKQVIALGDANEVTANLKMVEDVVRSEEVVVTGQAGATTRKQLGNAIGTVTNKDIQSVPATSIDQALAGKLSGALIQQNSGNPSGGMTIRLRGTNTFSGNADPLYIIDGVLMNNDSPALINFGGYQQNRLADLNPNDIERVEVLKGAAAAAIYGSRANNGVVQIFTKSGSAGAPRVTFSSTVQNSSLLRKLPMNLVPFATPINSLNYRLAAGQQAVNTLAFTPAQVAQFPYLADLQGKPVSRMDVQDLMFRQAWGTDQYLSIDGGSQSTRYSASLSYFGNEGILRGASFQRTTGRVRVEQTISDWASISATASYTYSNSQEVPNEPLGNELGSIGYGAMLGLIFTQNFVNPSRNATTGVYPGISNGVLDLATFGRGNPLEVQDRFNFNQKVNRFIGGTQLKLTPFAGFSFDYTLGVDTYTQNATAYIPPSSTAFEFPTGFARNAQAQVLQVNNDVNLAYQTVIGENIKSISQLGGTMQYERRQRFAGEARGLIPIVEIVPGGASQQSISENRSELVLYGAFAQQTFNFNDLLILTGAARVDVSSVFGLENRTQFFPKASVTFLPSELDGWKSSLGSAISQFKLRAAFGQSGGLTSIGPFDRFTAFESNPYTGLPGLAIGGRLGTPNVRPERQTEIEAGFDATFLDERIGLEFTYYNKQTRDVLMPRGIAPSNGFATQIANVGTLTNTGIEAILRVTPVASDDFTWNSTVIVNNNRNVLSDVPGGIIAGGQYATINGQSFPVMFERYYARNPDGSILLDQNGLPLLEQGVPGANGIGGEPLRVTRTLTAANGMTTSLAIPGGSTVLPNGVTQSAVVLRKVVGDPNPRLTGSWINEFRFLGALTLRVQLDGMYMFNLLNYTRRTSTFFGTHEDSGKELTGSLPAGHAAAVVNIFEHYVEAGDFTRLREISLTYDATSLFADTGLKSARFTLAARNVALFTNYRGYDPEVNSAAQGNQVRGADFSTVPPPRVFSLNMTLGF